jgi:hypothetical protein
VPGSLGEFSVWVDGLAVAEKSPLGPFPAQEALVDAVRRALGTR